MSNRAVLYLEHPVSVGKWPKTGPSGVVMPESTVIPIWQMNILLSAPDPRQLASEIRDILPIVCIGSENCYLYSRPTLMDGQILEEGLFTSSKQLIIGPKVNNGLYPEKRTHC